MSNFFGSHPGGYNSSNSGAGGDFNSIYQHHLNSSASTANAVAPGHGVLGQAPSTLPNLEPKSSSDFRGRFLEDQKKGLARRLTCSVVAIITSGVFLILLIQAMYSLTSVSHWGKVTKSQMAELEQANIVRLASGRAKWLTEVFGRTKLGALQVQVLAEQVLVNNPDQLVVEKDLRTNGGLGHGPLTWDYSVWHITDYERPKDAPLAGSTMEGLLNRSALMDVLFRGIPDKFEHAYVAAEEVPSPTSGNPGVNMQIYPGDNLTANGYNTWDTSVYDCDERFTDLGEDYVPTTYDPRCREWYQDGIEARGDVVFTKPYVFTDSRRLSLSAAGAVYDPAGDPEGTLLGVGAVDIDFEEIESQFNSLRVVGDEGYAYILAPNSGGEAIAHGRLDRSSVDTAVTIFDLETGLDESEFGAILMVMDEQCTGSDTYTNDGDTWILSWAHENASASSWSPAIDVCLDGYIIVVAVSERALVQAFSEAEKEINRIVIVASMIMAVIIAMILCLTICFARAVAAGIAKPVTQLVDVVRGVNRLDFSRQDVGSWMVNDVSSPEVAELMIAFQGMTTIVKFANTILESGNIEAARQVYVEALTLFKKLKNGRGESIVQNNLGTIYTLKARELTVRANTETRPTITGGRVSLSTLRDRLLAEADELFEMARTSYQLSIDDAQALCSGQDQVWGSLPSFPPAHGSSNDLSRATSSPFARQRGTFPASAELHGHGINITATSATDAIYANNNSSIEEKMDLGERVANTNGNGGANSFPGVDANADAVDARYKSRHNHDGNEGGIEISARMIMDRLNEDRPARAAAMALTLQLVNRKFNLAMCLADKGSTSGLPGRVSRDPQAIDQARELMKECGRLLAYRTDAVGVERRVECLLAVAALERDLPNRKHEAGEALDEAEREIIAYTSADGDADVEGLRDEEVVPLPGQTPPAPLAVLRQRLLAERGAERLSAGDTDGAIEHWNNAVVNCGKLMDPAAVRASLIGLRGQVSLDERRGQLFSTKLKVALEVVPESVRRGEAGMKSAGGRGDRDVRSGSHVTAIDAALDRLSVAGPAMQVDLCFVMDCTKSMQRWINQARVQLNDVITQAHNDVPNLELRVAFIGYRDFGDSKRYEGPYDFHPEAQLSSLLRKLNDVVEDGGDDTPEDMAGGLKLAAELSWRSPTRLCILIADGPCHGQGFHSYHDRFPAGDPTGLDPVQLLYTLQYELGVDFYFFSISSITDKMLNLLRNGVNSMAHKRRTMLGSATSVKDSNDGWGGSIEVSQSHRHQSSSVAGHIGLHGTAAGSQGRPLSVIQRSRFARLACCICSRERQTKYTEAKVQHASRNHCNDKPKFVEHKLGAHDNHFLRAVVRSVKVSLGITPWGLRVEDYT